jgi:hypothetical protein
VWQGLNEPHIAVLYWCDNTNQEDLMRQPNYQELKKRREAQKKRVKQEKLAKRQGGELPETTPKVPS